LIIISFSVILAGKETGIVHSFAHPRRKGGVLSLKGTNMDKILLILIACTMIVFVHRGWKDIGKFWVEFLIVGIFLLAALLFRKWSQKRKKMEK
jgi:hypothetical protein